jgi:hypothetical protein
MSGIYSFIYSIFNFISLDDRLYPNGILEVKDMTTTMTPKQAHAIWKATSRVATKTRHSTWMRRGGA